MIDEHEEIRKYIRDNDKRIEELEKSDKDTNQAFADVSIKFIEKEKNWEAINKQWESFHKEIAELKNDYIEIEAYTDANKIHIDEIKEVLRELITNLYLPNELRHELLIKLGVSHFDEYGNPAKLDSGGEKVRSAAHTEEHDCYKEWTKNIKVHNLDNLAPANWRGDWNNSKPPEHSLTQEDIDRLVKPFEELREDDIVNTLHKIKTIIKLDYPDLKIVKREDLQFLYDHTDFDAYLGDDIDDMYKERRRIKEEYSL